MTDLERLGRYYGDVRTLEPICSHSNVREVGSHGIVYKFCSDCGRPLNELAILAMRAVDQMFVRRT